MLNNIMKLEARIGRRINQPRGVRPAGVLLALLLGLVVAGLTGAVRGALAAQPDYSQVRDILYGQKHLLRNDDLIMGYAGYNSNQYWGTPSYFGGFYTLLSTNSKVDGSPGGPIPTIKNGTAGCATGSGCPAYWNPYFYKLKYDDYTPGAEKHYPPEHIAMGQAAGRFFNTNKDTLVQFPFQNLLNNNQGTLLVAFSGDDQGNGVLSETSSQPVGWVDGLENFIAAVGDFNGDGYDDLLMGASNGTIPTSFKIATAKDINNPQAGFVLGPTFSFNNYGIRDVAVGDFNGDGISDFASTYIALDYHLYLQTYYVTPTQPLQPITINAGSNLDLSADPKLGSAADYGYHPVTMTAGRFSTAPHDQLIIGSQLSNVSKLNLQVIDFSPKTVTPQLIYTYNSVDSGSYVTFKLKSGRLNPASTTDQLVWLSSDYTEGSTLQVITFDPSFNTDSSTFLTVASRLSGDTAIPMDYDSSGPSFWHFWGQDIAIGNFDHQQPSPTDPNTTERNPTLQIALAGINAGMWAAGGQPSDILGFATSGRLYIYNVDPANSFQLSQAAINNQSVYTELVPEVFSVPGSTAFINYVTGINLTAGDFRGRSYRLGAPIKITLEKAQPTVILAAPPMHADFVTSATGTSGLLNLSVIPEGYYSKYELDSSSNTTSNDTNTLSSSLGLKMTASATFGIGDEDAGDGATLKDTLTTTAELKAAAENKNGSFETTDFSISQQTGLTDQLWIKDALFFIYTYTVTGRSACPASKPNCADSEKLPLTVQFTVPAPSEIKTPPASNLEWYQPPWEYGNIFSYPAGYSQLQSYVPDIQKLSEDVAFYTDASNITIKNSWNSGSNTSQTVSFNQNYSIDSDLSVSQTVSIDDIVSVGFSGSLDLSASLGFGQAHESTTTLQATTGIIAQKPGSFAEPIMYAYAVKPVIFGRQPPAGTTSSNPSNADINTFGLLQTAYVADPTDTSAGLWWAQAYGDLPDIALNHPNRLIVSTPGLASPTIPDNCRPTGTGASQMDCVELAPSDPDNPWMSEVHYMRGFFISSANFADQGVAPGQGPQLANATAGDKLRLTARVYNYSLASMASDSTVYVRFYGTQWKEATSEPYPSSTFQIGNDVKVSPISPFSATPGDPVNWVLVSSDTFDTSSYANRYLTFFVVVWAQKSDGTLLREATGHGLNALPGTINSFADAVALEEVVSGSERSYSNNIGFYNAPFFVLPAATSVAAEPDAGLVSLSMGKVKTSKKSAKASKAITVSTLLKAGNKPVNEFMVDFYDGDPAAGGRMFDVERVPFIKAKGSYRVKVNFRSNTCGRRNIHVKAADGKPYAMSRKSQRVKIQCPRPKA